MAGQSGNTSTTGVRQMIHRASWPPPATSVPTLKKSTSALQHKKKCPTTSASGAASSAAAPARYSAIKMRKLACMCGCRRALAGVLMRKPVCSAIPHHSSSKEPSGTAVNRAASSRRQCQRKAHKGNTSTAQANAALKRKLPTLRCRYSGWRASTPIVFHAIIAIPLVRPGA
jgi:hypothetical protein